VATRVSVPLVHQLTSEPKHVREGKLDRHATTSGRDQSDARKPRPARPRRRTPPLRHTFASLLVALGTDPGAVMDQLGHEDAAFTLRVNRHGMRRDE